MTAVRVTIGDRTYRLGRPTDLSIPLDPHGRQPNAFGAPAATARPYSGDGFTLDTRAGGSCNCEVVEFTPHCNGTHTESVGHLTRERFPITAVEVPQFLACSVVSVTPHGREICAGEVERATANTPLEWLEALVVRTLPNSADKATRRWEDAATPHFTAEAVRVMRWRGVRHLLVDLPSLDPLRDDGRLAAHRVFWDMPPGSQELPDDERAQSRTVTEMIFVPDDVPDGRYLLTIQTPRLVSDAAPSRPIVFALDEVP
jgi:kynurenine formamidase